MVKLKASMLQIELCEKEQAVKLVRLWHSRLPKTQLGPWQFAFKAHYDDTIFAVALWSNPSARMLPNHWLELRRMACSPVAPKYTASRMLGEMVKYLKRYFPEREKCISYQDLNVHSGTIYKAGNWIPEYFSRPRCRDRSKPRKGTNRNYRSDMNTPVIASSGKIRWAYLFNESVDHKKIKTQMAKIDRQIKKCTGVTL